MGKMSWWPNVFSTYVNDDSLKWRYIANDKHTNYLQRHRICKYRLAGYVRNGFVASQKLHSRNK